jgi:hypothetical protein
MLSEKEGYNNASINHCFNKASGSDRKDLIQYTKRTRTTECHLSSHTILRSVIYPTSFVSTGQPYKTPRTVQNLQSTTRLGFQGTQKFERYLGERWYLPSIYQQCSVSKMWFETMYDVQKHPMHTTIQQHTYRSRIHHILQCQLQDRKYYLPPGMCNLRPSMHRRN